MNDELDAIELSARQRSTARELYQFFVALRQQGFTETQSMTLVSDLLTSSVIDQAEQEE